MSKRTHKTIVTVFAILLIVSQLAAPVLAFEMVNKESDNITFTDEELFISEDVAEEIAKLFISDMNESGLTSWTSSVQIIDVVPMYDGSEERNVVAYTIKLNKGYVVVSAYVDVPNIILEWSDEATPLYEELQLTDNDDIVYNGVLYYYKDDGTGILKTLDGISVQRNQLINYLEVKRDCVHIPATVKEYLANLVDKSSKHQDNPTRSNYAISDPFAHALNLYTGPFVANDWQNHWEAGSSSFECHTTGEFGNLGNGFYLHCGPTAITNMLINFGNRFGTSSICNEDADDIFLTVANIGIDELCYFNINNPYLGGTPNYAAGGYILCCFSAYNVQGIEVNGRYNINYSNINTSLSNDRLVYVLLDGHDYYGDHHVLCYAYTRLVSSTTGNYYSYIKVADGWFSSPRYIDLISLDGDKYWEVKYYSYVN